MIGQTKEGVACVKAGGGKRGVKEMEMGNRPSKGYWGNFGTEELKEYQHVSGGSGGERELPMFSS